MSQEAPQVPETSPALSMTEALAASGEALVAELKATFMAASETMTLSAELQQEASELLGSSFGETETEATTPTHTQNSSFIERTADRIKASVRKVAVVGVIGSVALSTVGGAFAEAATSSGSTKQKPSSSVANTIAKGHTPRDAMLRQVQGDATAAEGVKHLDEMHTTPGLFRQNLRDIFKMAPKSLDHRNGAENSMLAKFQAGAIGPRNQAYAMAFAINADTQQLAQVYNASHGGSEDDTQLPSGVSRAQALKSEEAVMTSRDTKFQTNPDLPAGAEFHNHGERNNVVFSAGNLNVDGQKMFAMTTGSGEKVYAKFTNDCENLGAVAVMHFVEEVPAQVVTVTVPSPETPAPVTPTPEHHQHRVHHHKQAHHKRTTSTTTTTTTTITTTPPSSTPPKINNIKVALPPPGPDHASQSPGTPSEQEPSVPTPGPGPASTPPETTTTPAAPPTIPENGQPTPTEPAAPVNTGTSTNTPEAPVPPVGGVDSTAPSPTGGVEGQGGPVPSGTTSSTSTVSSN